MDIKDKLHSTAQKNEILTSDIQNVLEEIKKLEENEKFLLSQPEFSSKLDNLQNLGLSLQQRAQSLLASIKLESESRINKQETETDSYLQKTSKQNRSVFHTENAVSTGSLNKNKSQKLKKFLTFRRHDVKTDVLNGHNEKILKIEQECRERLERQKHILTNTLMEIQVSQMFLKYEKNMNRFEFVKRQSCIKNNCIFRLDVELQGIKRMKLQCTLSRIDEEEETSYTDNDIISSLQKIELEDKIENLLTEKQNFLREIEGLETIRNQINQDLQDNQKHLSELQNQLKIDHEEHCKEMEQLNISLTNETLEKEKFKCELDRVECELQKQITISEDLNSSLQEQSKLQTELQKAKTMIQNLQENIQELKTKIKDHIKQSKEELDIKEMALKEKDAELYNLQQIELPSLKNEIENLIQKWELAEGTSKDFELNYKRKCKEVSDLSLELWNLKTELLDALEKQKIISVLQLKAEEKLEELLVENSTLKHQLEQNKCTVEPQDNAQDKKAAEKQEIPDISDCYENVSNLRSTTEAVSETQQEQAMQDDELNYSWYYAIW